MKETHNEIFSKLQEEYLKVRGEDKKKEKQILGEMYLICRQIQKNYIIDYCINKRIYFEKEELEDKIEDAALYIITKYLKKENFKIDKLSAYAYFGMMKTLFKNSKEVKTISIEEIKKRLKL